MSDFENLKKLAGEEKVNHPSHYNREDAMEAIDEMILVFGKEAVKNFCLCIFSCNFKHSLYICNKCCYKYFG